MYFDIQWEVDFYTKLSAISVDDDLDDSDDSDGEDLIIDTSSHPHNSDDTDVDTWDRSFIIYMDPRSWWK